MHRRAFGRSGLRLRPAAPLTAQARAHQAQRRPRGRVESPLAAAPTSLDDRAHDLLARRERDAECSLSATSVACGSSASADSPRETTPGSGTGVAGSTSAVGTGHGGSELGFLSWGEACLGLASRPGAVCVDDAVHTVSSGVLCAPPPCGRVRCQALSTVLERRAAAVYRTRSPAASRHLVAAGTRDRRALGLRNRGTTAGGSGWRSSRRWRRWRPGCPA